MPRCARVAEPNTVQKKIKRTSTLHGVFATADQQKQVDLCLTKALVSGCVPFAFVENTHLQEALAVVGLKAPTRKQVAGRLLDEIAAETEAFSLDKVAAMEHPVGASDGWRKKYCQGGEGMQNFTVMGDRGSLLSCISMSSKQLLFGLVLLHRQPCLCGPQIHVKGHYLKHMNCRCLHIRCQGLHRVSP
jgi:hypothetical protein